ncbi:MAG: hypothetical protein QOC62_6094 [Mycobacterium sp.]|jgi:hypothetical protein|nr:hypothetical protein [Mycobacterium sp.]
MIERYAKMRRERLFHSNGEAANGEEYVILQDSARGHFPVYLSARGSSPDVVQLRAHFSARRAHTKRFRLHDCVNRFNDRDKLLTATVRESHDSSALGVVGDSRFWVRDEGDFGPFVRFVDMSLALAVQLVESVYEEMQLPSAAELERSLPMTG